MSPLLALIAPLPLISRGADPAAVAAFTARHTTTPLDLTLGDTP